jgi:hypothetical protein
MDVLEEGSIPLRSELLAVECATIVEGLGVLLLSIFECFIVNLICLLFTNLNKVSS